LSKSKRANSSEGAEVTCWWKLFQTSSGNREGSVAAVDNGIQLKISDEDEGTVPTTLQEYRQ